ncbi:MAG: hypothetical protein AAGA99_03505 [Actinomycetota bacterium]
MSQEMTPARIRTGLAVVVALAGLAAMVTVATASSGSDGWLRNDHARRLVVEVDANGTPRLDEVVEVSVDLTRTDGDLDPDSVVVVEVDGGGDEIGEVPVQMEDLSTPNSATIVFAATGTTGAGDARRFHVYFGLDGDGVAGWSGTPLVEVTNSTDEGQAVWRIDNQTGRLSYVKDAGAFSSYDDTTGDDWIGYNTRGSGETGGESDFRGIPNAVFDPSGSDDFFHPAHPTSSSTLEVNGPVRLRIRSEATGAAWVSEWTVGPRTATFEMVAADTPAWWFLYEGPPGGTLEPATDSWIVSDGTESDLTAGPSNADLPDPEWIAYRDGVDDRSLLVVSHTDDSTSDRRTVQDGAMVVFGFGRTNSTPLLTGAGQVMSIELVDDRTLAGLGDRAAAHRTAASVSASALETRPGTTTTSTTTTTTTTTTVPPTTTTTTTTAPTTSTTTPPTTATTEAPTPTTTTQPPETPDARPYRLLDRTGRVYSFPTDPGDPGGAPGKLFGDAVDILTTPTGEGYWILDEEGSVQAVGDAPDLGELDPAVLLPDERAATLSGTPDGAGYWIATDRGRVVSFGTAAGFEDLVDLGIADVLNGPIVDSVATPAGDGFYLLGSDGGVFGLGNARFYGSMGGARLNAPVNAIVADPDGQGYWLVANDGGVFAFSATFEGSMGGVPLNAPIVGMVPYGDGYLMVAADGGVFVFSDLPFLGSLGDEPPIDPVVAIDA